MRHRLRTLTCAAAQSLLQLCVIDAEMLTPEFGELQVRTATRLSVMLLRGFAAKHSSPSLSNLNCTLVSSHSKIPLWVKKKKKKKKEENLEAAPKAQIHEITTGQLCVLKQ